LRDLPFEGYLMQEDISRKKGDNFSHKGSTLKAEAPVIAVTE